MSAGAGSDQDFYLNLAPIIDCFTVLIAFMLMSASFLSIGILDAGISAGGAKASEAKPPPINLTLELMKNQSLRLVVTGKTNFKRTLTAQNGEWNYKNLTEELQKLKKKFPQVKAITLKAENSIPYKDIVKTMDVTKEEMPAILLGGF
ncbi:MAG: hypothetical protein CL678_08285 [Bdellovibrionaceae bacterium]|nr:hypothetical protein [Pseudobdellovibrionaceae bacterium]